jgi:hypothetical protein
MIFTIKELTRLLNAMIRYSINDKNDRELISRLEYRLEVMKAEQKIDEA